MDWDLPRKLVDRRIKELGLSRAQVSELVGRKATYIRDYLIKGSPRQLPERERKMLADILKVSEDELRGPSVALPARKYERSVANSLANELRHPYAPVAESKILAEQSIIGSVLDLPVYGTGPVDSNGEGYALSELAVDWVARPPMLSRVRDAYAVIVPRDVMAPVVRAGTVLMFHPHLPPRVGDICLFRSTVDDKVYIKGAEYRGETAELWKVRHYNPPRDFTLKKSEFQVCHRAVGAYFP